MRISARRNREGGLRLSDIGNFYSEHRKLIDSRKAHLARVGIFPQKDADKSRPAGRDGVGVNAPDVAPLKDTIPTDPAGSAVSRPGSLIAMPSQADVLKMPTTKETPLLDATHKPMRPHTLDADYAPPKLPKLLGVNATLQE